MIAAPTVSDPLVTALADLSPGAIRCGAEVGAGHAADRSVTPGVRPELLLRPADTSELSLMLAACNRLGRPVVVQGGRTGLAGGASPVPGEVALSLERMRGLGPVDPQAGTVLAEAGVPLQQVQEAAAAQGLRLPVDIGARGSATVGGMIATNAGGIRVLAHGMMRRQVLGLEVVLADGTVLSRLGTLAKDNTGPDLKHLFIGTEGTLGVVSRAMLALVPAPGFTAMAFAAFAGIPQALAALARLRGRLGRRLAAFEFIERRVHALAVEHGAVSPLPPGAPAYGMIEVEGASDADRALFEEELAALLSDGLVTDATVSRGARDEAAWWRFRDELSEALFVVPDTHGFDIGVPPAALAAFLPAVEAEIRAADPDARPWIFGHLGDGNLHYVVTTRQPEALARIVYRRVAAAGGALSAEHGIGREKHQFLPLFRSPAEIATMRRLKVAMDPAGILNPGRVLPEQAP